MARNALLSGTIVYYSSFYFKQGLYIMQVLANNKMIFEFDCREMASMVNGY